MKGEEISFECRNCLSELDKLHLNLKEIGKSLGLSREDIFRINLAMVEVVSNIISHGYSDRADHWIKITISHQNGTLIFRIEDDGIPFNPCEAEVPDLESPLEERRIGGLGCHIMRCLMDDIDYQRRGNKNILTMKKVIDGA